MAESTHKMADIVYTDEQICAKCVDENEVVYDLEEDSVKRLVSVDIKCPEELNKELLKNISVCSSVLLMFMKQQIIAEEPRVRYHPANDIYGLKAKIHETGLSPETRQYLQTMSETGCQILKQAGMLETLVELDSERPGKVVAFGKTLKMVGSADILFFASKEISDQFESVKQKPKRVSSTDVSETSATSFTGSSDSTSGIGRHTESEKSSEKCTKSRHRTKTERRRTETSKPTNKIDKFIAENDKEGCKDSNNANSKQRQPTDKSSNAPNKLEFDRHKVAADSNLSRGEAGNQVHLVRKHFTPTLDQSGRPLKGELSTTPLDQSEQSEDCSDWSRCVVTIAVTARNHLSASAIFKHLLLSYLQPLSKFYFLALHLGPLVDKQEMVLYEYLPSQKLTDLIKSYDGSTINYEDDNNAQDENEFVISLTVKKTVSLKPESIKEKPVDQNYLDMGDMEKCFREEKGSRIQTVAGLKQYFRYLVNDCEGVKDHKEDKKNRYERYMAKKEKKKQQKQMKKESQRRSEEEEEDEQKSLATDCTYTFITD